MSNPPKLADFLYYDTTGRKVNNNDFKANLQKIVNYLNDGTTDITINSFTAGSDCAMGGAKITGLGTPSASTDASTKAYVDSASIPVGYINGLILSNNGSAPNTDIDITSGVCKDVTNVAGITLAGLTKRLSTAWASGTGAGMLDTGSIANSTWYHIFAISKTDGTSDILASTSATNPSLPAGYTYKRRIASVKTDGSANIIAFIQIGDFFEWKARITDRSRAAAPNTTRNLLTISTPLGIVTKAVLAGNLASASTTDWQGIICDPNETDVAPTKDNCNWVNYQYDTSYNLIIQTNTSSQVAYRATSTNATFSVCNIGYFDLRGKN